MWSLIGVYAALAVFDNPSFYLMLADTAGLMGTIWTYRTFAIIILMVIGTYFDKYKYYKGWADHDFYRRQFAWGDQIKLYNTWTSTEYENSNGWYTMLDMQLEAFTIIGGATAASLFEVGLKVWRPLAALGFSTVPHTPYEYQIGLKANAAKSGITVVEKPAEEAKEAEAEEGEDDDGDFE